MTTPPAVEFDVDGETEISISVRQRGGQVQLAGLDGIWSIANVVKAAAQFPETCRHRAEYHSAILSPYTTLPSFWKLPSAQRNVPRCNSARLYASDLLDDYANFMRLEKRIEEMRLSLESCQEASGSSAYSPTIAGLNSASLDVRKYMVAITCEADRIGKDPTIAKEAFLKTEYAKPSVVASRLPVLVTNVVPPSDVVNKPLSTLPADQSADVKLWQWVHVPGWGSEGHDLFGHGEGSASPTEMMLKIYEWEAAHPGHFARGFNLRGEVKSKIQKWKDIKPSPPGADLYVRVLINDRWTFSPTMDSGGNDFDSGFKADHSIDIDIVEALLALESVPTAVAFNSNGHVKQRVHFPLLPLGRFTGKPHLGLWIRKSALSV